MMSTWCAFFFLGGGCFTKKKYSAHAGVCVCVHFFVARFDCLQSGHHRSECDCGGFWRQKRFIYCWGERLAKDEGSSVFLHLNIKIWALSTSLHRWQASPNLATTPCDVPWPISSCHLLVTNLNASRNACGNPKRRPLGQALIARNVESFTAAIC